MNAIRRPAEFARLPCRLLPHEVGDGPWNMAVDEALLDSVARDSRTAVVRTYAWTTPTLSLGYFQPYAAAEADPRWHGRPVVRRATGGGALWHDRELTYAVVVPAAHPLARPSLALYRAIHRAIADRLTAFGLDARRRGEVAAGDRPFLCFLDSDADDIVVGPDKLVGSAQRRRAGAVLQHGSLLLARSPVTPELPGLLDLATPLGPATDPVATWRDLLRNVLPAVVGSGTIPGDFTNQERARADTLRNDVYSNPAWTRRR